ncbi:MAG: hypothetical protein D9V44_01610 [Actinobacteria bacterium]|nr:MAG: hypothetical protein D9V44_01610 [Actinomycetota bacterium]
MTLFVRHVAAILDSAFLETGEAVQEVVRIEIGSGGLPSCVRCGTSDTAVYRAAAEVIAELLAADARDDAVLMLRGVEAFGHPALPEIIGAAVSAGWRRVGLQTAGGLLGVGGNAPGVLHAGVRHFEIVMAPGVPPMSGTGGLEPLDGLRMLVSAASTARVRIAVSVILPTCRHSVEALPAVVADLAAAGAGSVRIVAEPGACTGSRALAAVIAACDTGVVNAVWVDVSGIELPAGHAMHRAPGVLS